uniref:Uncharacterized protein n=1 Tax=Anopheles maculatus TaxID=74869 RepID=A0A182TB08_9DIPT
MAALIPHIIEQLRMENVTPEEKDALAEIFEDLWPLMVAEADPSSRRNPWTDVSYRERLQSWGLYPKVFRYGTTNHHAAIMERKRAELSWLKRFVRENEEMIGNRPANIVSNESVGRDRQYEKFKEKHFQKMEQDALEVLWQH